MKLRTGVILVVAAFLVQPFLTNLFPGYIVPDLLLCILFVMTLMYKEETLLIPLAIGLLLMLWRDVATGQYAGVGTLALAVVVGYGWLLRRWINLESGISVFITGMGAIALRNLTYWILGKLLGSPYSFLYVVKLMPSYWVVNLFVIMFCYGMAIRKVRSRRRDRYFK